MTKNETHILIEYPSKDTTLLYRKSDGMALACRQGTTVIYGDDPNPAKKDHRNFLDATYATMYLRRLADLDLDDVMSRASFEERNGEPRIMPATDSRVLGFKH